MTKCGLPGGGRLYAERKVLRMNRNGSPATACGGVPSFLQIKHGMAALRWYVWLDSQAKGSLSSSHRMIGRVDACAVSWYGELRPCT